MSSPLASFLRVSAYVDNRVLAAGVAESFTKPAGYSAAVITTNSDCYIRRGGAAAVPAGDVTDGTGSILIPAGQSRIVDLTDSPGATPLASFSIICAGAAITSVEWFS